MSKCIKCGKSHEDGKRVAQCQVCKRDFCADCLKKEAIDSHLMEAAEIAGLLPEDVVAPETFMFGSEESGKQMCPACFEAVEAATTT